MTMDSDSIHLAHIVVHSASTFGFITNAIAVLTIAKCVDMHTSFGILCACLAANNSVMVVLNSVWYSMPDSDIFHSGSTFSRVIGMISGTLWIVGIRYHLLISINRLIAIVFPLKRKKYVNAKSTTMAVLFIVLATILQCSPLVLVSDVWFCFDRTSMQWKFSQSINGKFFQDYHINLSNVVELAALFVVDIATLVHLRFYHKNSLNSASSKSKAVEIRMFKQALSQSLPLVITFICFAIVTPQLADDFGKFLNTTFVWHLTHGIDGLIIDLFHTRLNLFYKSKTVTRTIADSSFAPTTVV